MDQIQSTLIKLRHIQHQHWIHHEVFSWQWWFLVIALALSWIIAVLLFDRSRLLELLVCFFIMSYLISLLDALGLRLGLWNYRYHEVPYFTRLFSVDLGALPVIYTLYYQYFTRWLDYLGILIVSGAIFAFVFEPLFESMHILIYIKWSSYYSFPIYILIGVLIKWGMRGIKKELCSH